MSKGLDLILAKIKLKPSGTLVSRYLALIAELPDERDKVKRALDVAELLVKERPPDAMRIAHMAYQSDRGNLRALDLLIACFVERGRHAKAEVLRIERDKLAKGVPPAPLSARVPPPSKPAAARGFALSDEAADRVTPEMAQLPGHLGLGSPGNDLEGSSISELDLGDNDLSVANVALDELFPKDPAAGRHQPDFRADALGTGPAQLLAGFAASTPPGDTVMPFGRDGMPRMPQGPATGPAGTAVYQMPNVAAAAAAAATQHTNVLPQSVDLGISPGSWLPDGGRVYKPPVTPQAASRPAVAEPAPFVKATGGRKAGADRSPIVSGPSLAPAVVLGLDPGVPVAKTVSKAAQALPKPATEAPPAAVQAPASAPGSPMQQAAPGQAGWGAFPGQPPYGPGTVGAHAPGFAPYPGAPVMGYAPVPYGYVPAFGMAPLPPGMTQATASGFGVLVDLIDRNLRLGLLADVRELLRQTAMIASHEQWWQARSSLLERTERLQKAEADGKSKGAIAGETRAASLPLAGQDFWEPLAADLNRISKDAKGLLVPYARLARLKGLVAANKQGAKLPEGFVRALAELDHRVPGCDAAGLLGLKWDLIQGLWGTAPDLACAAVLEELTLTRATPGFWGLYLDALLAGDCARRAALEVRRGLEAHPQLPWARIAWARLPVVWKALRTYGFDWSEDAGVPTLLDQLARRPRPKLAAMVVGQRP